MLRVWGAFPAHATWDSLAPRGAVRNGRGQAVAMAYREHGGEPFHYVVFSYDERGRVEAILRHNDNLGFDAVYYRYNSADAITLVRVADPLRQHALWYGYDFNGRVDSVWTRLGAVGTGLGTGAGPRHPAPLDRPDTVDITYTYDLSGHLATVTYPQATTTTFYTYTQRDLLSSILSWKGGPLFEQDLDYDSTGRIVTNTWKHGAGPTTTEHYRYDGARRIAEWSTGTDTARYTYDGAGNRSQSVRTGTGRR